MLTRPPFSIRTKTYTAFDGDTDLNCYNLLRAWSQDKNNPFSLNDAHDINDARDDSKVESINRQLKERLDVSKNFILIIGSQTHQNRKGCLQYEISYALRNKLPIILVFKGYSPIDPYSNELWRKKLHPSLPYTLRAYQQDKYCLICPFSRDVITYALRNYTNNRLPNKGYSWLWKRPNPNGMLRPLLPPAKSTVNLISKPFVFPKINPPNDGKINLINILAKKRIEEKQTKQEDLQRFLKRLTGDS